MIFALIALCAQEPAPNTPQGDVVIVRAERLLPRGDDIPDPITLPAAILQGQAGTRLDEALRMVPGVGLFRRTPSGPANATIQGISLRPIAPNGAGRALASLDGVPQNDPFGGWVYWGRYDPLFLKSVDIRRGGAGAGFGPLALTGTLDLTEARGDPAVAVFDVGSFGTKRAAVRQSIRTQGAVFTAMANFDETDGNFALEEDQRGPADLPINSAFFGATLVTDIARDDGAWSFRASGFEESKGGGISGAKSKAQGLDVSVARRLKGVWGQGRVLLYAQGRDFSNQAAAVGAGRTATTPTLDQIATPASALGGSLVIEGANLPRITMDWRRAEGRTEELFRYFGSNFTRARRAGGRQDFAGIGIAPSQPLRLGPAPILLDGTLRLDYWSNRDAIRIETDRNNGLVTLNERARDASGTLASGHLSAKISGVAISVYRTFRPPSLNELHRPFRLGNDVTEANAALRPETLTGFDFDFRHRRDLFAGVLESRATVYANRLYGPITNVTIATGPGNFPRVGFLPAGGALRERRNAGRIDATGLEASLGWRGDDTSPSGLISFSMTDARVEGGTLLPQLTGKRPAQAPRWSAVASLTVPMKEGTQLGAVLRGEGTRFDDDLNTRRLPAYGALDVRYDREITDNIAFFVSLENAFDSKVATARSGDGLVSFTQGRMLRLGIKFGGDLATER